MAHIEPQSEFELLANIKKRPGMYLNKKCMSCLSALEFGVFIGYTQCCRDNKLKYDNNADNSLLKAFLDGICEKYEVNSPWYNEFIKKCGSDELAYDVFMDEFDRFIKANGIEISGT